MSIEISFIFFFYCYGGLFAFHSFPTRRSSDLHFGAGLGVVELTTAIHYVFDTPRDRLIWDVGHQAYPHKILTGRRDRIRSEEHTSELQSRGHLVCRLLLEKKKETKTTKSKITT